MASIEELRQRQREHARQLEAVNFVKTSDLVARWGWDVEVVLAIPREELPYLEYGKTRARRYDPRDVETYEDKAKRGEVTVPIATRDINHEVAS